MASHNKKFPFVLLFQARYFPVLLNNDLIVHVYIFTVCKDVNANNKRITYFPFGVLVGTFSLAAMPLCSSRRIASTTV